MAVKRLDHIVAVVEDLTASIAFFRELGLEVEGQMPIEGTWVDRVNGIDDVRVDIVMMKTPDGYGKLELTKFHNPAVLPGDPNPAPPNTLGYRSVMFAVDDVAADVERLRRHGGELVGEIADYKDVYRLCYVRGPSGIIVALAQELR